MTNLTLKDYKKDLEEINLLKKEKKMERDSYMSKLYNINNNFSCSTCNNLYIKLVGTKNGISEDLDFIALNITLKNNYI
mgnify:CR=1 FL=1